MFSRMLGIPLLLGAAVGVPYVATNGPDLEGLWNKATEQAGQSGDASGQQAALPTGSLANGADISLTGNLADQRVTNVTLREALRFDISKEWVYQRWARKSTALSKLGLYGIRVALVTGTELHDVAGSLTYLFGQDGRLQQISFRGRTGDTTQLVMLAAKQYGLQPQPTAIAGEQLFQVRQGEHVYSELRTRPSSVLRTNSLHDSFMVNLELQRPDVTTTLPAVFLPLPEVKQPAAEVVAQEEAKKMAEAGEQAAADENSAGDSWKAFFPRSRVPSEQVESLDQRGRLW